jgi:predicted nucleotidyltransferase
VIEVFLDEQSAKRDHVVVALSGSRGCGLASPNSDWDLKCVHVAPTETLLGLSAPQPAFNTLVMIDDVEIDYTSNELGQVLAGMLLGNGNFFERVLGRAVVRRSALFDDLVAVAKRSLSRRVYRHYQGFARGQLALVEKEHTGKILINVLRMLFTGIHLLKSGEVETDLAVLAGDEVKELVEAKRTGGRYEAIDPGVVDSWRPRITRLFEELDRARDASVLPEAPAVDEVDDWLVGVRRARLSSGEPPRS